MSRALTARAAIPGVVTAAYNTPAKAAARALKIGPRFGSVTLAPLYSGAYQRAGTYAGGTTYVVNDVVIYATTGYAYRCIANSTGNVPTDATHWVALSDDWARWIAVVNACAGKWPLKMLGGLWLCQSYQTLQRNDVDIEVIGHADFIQALPYTGGVDNAAFTTRPTGFDAITDTTFAINNTPGTKTIHLNAAPIVGQTLELRHVPGGVPSPWTVYFEVDAISGAVLTGTVDLSGLAYPGDFGVKDITLYAATASHLLTFSSPANAGEVVTQLNAAILAAFGTQVVTASLTGGTNHLVLTALTGSGSISLTSGTLAAATIGHVTTAKAGVAVTLERPLLRQYFATVDTAKSYGAMGRKHALKFNGATISGTGDRLVEEWSLQHSTVSGLHADSVMGTGGGASLGLSADGASVDFHFVDCTIDGWAPIGIILEQPEHGTIERCTAVNCSVRGLAIHDGIACGIIDGIGHGCEVGAALTGDTDDTGCDNCYVQGGAYYSNVRGVQLAAGGSRNKVVNVAVDFNSINGIQLDGTSTPGKVNNTILSAISAKGNGGTSGCAIAIGTGVLGTRVNGYVGVDNNGDINTASEFFLDSFTSTGSALCINSTGTLPIFLTNVKISSTVLNFHALELASGSKTYVNGGSFAMPASGYLANLIGTAKCTLTDVVGLSGNGPYCANGSTLYLMGNTDLAAAAAVYAAGSTDVTVDKTTTGH